MPTRIGGFDQISSYVASGVHLVGQHRPEPVGDPEPLGVLPGEQQRPLVDVDGRDPRLRHRDRDRQADHAVPAAEVEHLAGRLRRSRLAQQHAGADVEPALGEDPGSRGQLQPVAPDVGPHRDPLERGRRVGGEVVLLHGPPPVPFRVHRPPPSPTYPQAADAALSRDAGRWLCCGHDRHSSAPDPDTSRPACNSVTLVGRVSAVPERRDLPSGDHLVTLRVVVDRPPQRGVTKRAVDVIDVACWTKRTQRTRRVASSPDDGVRVEGALRRRFFATAGGRASRYEVEASRLVRVSRAGGLSVRTARDSRARAPAPSSAG